MPVLGAITILQPPSAGPRTKRAVISRMNSQSRPIVSALLISVVAGCAPTVTARPIAVAPTAPRDAPVYVTSDTALAKMFVLLEPCRKKAMAQWPSARSRFLAGLPQNQTLFVTTRLHDAASRVEQVFVAVDRINGDAVSGRIWSEISAVQGYARNQSISLPQSEIVDWMISKPDGSEEGNWMGKFIDAAGPSGTAPRGICD